MCLHEDDEIKSADDAAEELNQARRAAFDDKRVGVVHVRNKADDSVVIAWFAEATDPGSVAMTIKDLFTWHASELDSEKVYVDLSHVNDMRNAVNLGSLDTADLPEVKSVIKEVPDFDNVSLRRRAARQVEHFVRKYWPEQKTALAAQAA